ncbi:MAG: hypothetical protein A2X11_06145 [Bacteroidetes bacterium GWE2_42_24]|nr:MAG: hypothetical protein A2X11_06145 [Bacteroidetes bacterium GWE2_42_24]
MLLAGCDTVRILWWNKAGIDDYRKFPAGKVYPLPAEHNRFEFVMPADRRLPDIIINQQGFDVPLHELLVTTKTVAWLAMKDDTLLTEFYEDGFDQSSLLSSFSVAKSFVGSLVGIAAGKGQIRSVDQPVTDFLPYLKDTAFKKVTLRHLLNMRSGIDFEEGYSSFFSPMPKLYYGRNVREQVGNLQIALPPDVKYRYQSMNTQLLSMALEAAVGMPINRYLQQMIWQPLGMESEAQWSSASRSDTTIKSFCCLNAIGRDYLRFGRLWMNGGLWGQSRIIPEWYVNETYQDTLDSKDSRGYAYSHHWRILPDGSLFAKGVLGQYIWINPHKKIVIVRFGETDANLDWVKIFRQMEGYYFSASSSKNLL